MLQLSHVKLNHISSGALYFKEGVKMLVRPELRKYILIPLLINCTFFFAATAAFIEYYESVTTWLFDYIPQGFGFISEALKTLVWFLAFALLVIIYAYSFNIITNTFAAPFYGRLAQRVEELISGKKLPDEPLSKMIPRTMGREFHKLIYFLIRGLIILLVILLIGTIPILNVLAPAIGLLWGAWCMTLQYSDYPADNNQIDFRRLRKNLRKRIYSSVSFGGFVMICSMIPIVNIITMPAAVIGATLYWMHELKPLSQPTDTRS